jgi:peptide/nickel transport system permease protein
MRAYLFKRLLMTILVLFVVMVILSLLTKIVPGDPARAILGTRSTPELEAKIRSEMDLDQPVHIQIARFIGRLIQGDLGKDLWTGRPISNIVGDVILHTILLAWAALGLAVIIGVPLGVYSASHPYSWVDRLTGAFAVSSITVPSYVAGLFLLLIFAVQMRVLPAIGLGQSGDLIDYLRHLLLPALALSINWIGYLARLVRASLLEVLNTNYIRAARAAGLPSQQILFKYALKNALIPTVAVLGVGMGKLMGGAVFVEIIFSRPGMGSLLFSAIQTRNYPVVRASMLVVALLFVFANLLAELIYSYLDPRIQLGKRNV